MSNSIVKLGEIATLIRGITYKPNDICTKNSDNAVACMRTKNIQSELDKDDIVWIPKSKIKNSSKFLQPEDILVSSANSWNLVGKACWVPPLKFTASAGGFISILRGDPSKVHNRYLFYWFTSIKTQIMLRSFSNKTTNISNLDHKRTLNLEIPLPPIEEQRRIAKILDKIKYIEDLHNKRNLHLNSFIDSLFNSYFGDLLTNSKSFNQRNFEDIVYFQEGPGIRKWQFRDAGIKLLNVKNIVNGELDISNTFRYLEESEVNKKYKHFLLEKGDLVMSSSGVTWGKIAYVDSNDLPLCLNTSMIRLKPKSKEIRHSFIFYFIQSRAFKSQIKKLITGSAQPNFGPSHLKQIRCPLPSLSKQLEFEIILNKYNKMQINYKQIRNKEKELLVSTLNSLL